MSERYWIGKIRKARHEEELPTMFRVADVRELWPQFPGPFLSKHRVGNPGGETELFVRVAPGLYRLVTPRDGPLLRRRRNEQCGEN